VTVHQPATLLDRMLRTRVWSYARFAREYRQQAVLLGLPAEAPEERQLKRWRSGRVGRPRAAACEVLEALFGHPVGELLAAPPAPPARQSAATRIPKARRPDRRAALKAAIGAGAVALYGGPPDHAVTEAMAWTRDLERTDIGPGTLDHLALAVERLGTTYAAAPPARTWPTVLLYRRQAASLLAGRHTLKEGRELTRCAGMLSVVLAWLAHDLGDTATAEAYCLDGWTHGEHSEVPEVCAWADDCRATVALYDDRPAEALAAAVRGLSLAPAGSDARARLAGQVARAQAATGRLMEYRSSAALARGFEDRLPTHGVGLFAADVVRISSFEASGYRWLGLPEPARRSAEEAVARYREVPYAKQSPTRMAIALLDLAMALAALGEPEGALELGREALATERPAAVIAIRAEELALLLMRSHRKLARVREFAERLRSCSGEPAGRLSAL
jgi:tetratricopeptide (TPR) repeat protein